MIMRYVLGNDLGGAGLPCSAWQKLRREDNAARMHTTSQTFVHAHAHVHDMYVHVGAAVNPWGVHRRLTERSCVKHGRMARQIYPFKRPHLC